MRQSKKFKQNVYSNLRKKVLSKISKLEKSPYGKDMESSIRYYKERLRPVSELKNSRDLKFAMLEAEKADKMNWTQAERRRIRKRRIEWVRNEIGDDRVKTYKDVKKFDEFLEAVRNFSIGTIFDSYRATKIYKENPSLSKKELVSKYDEYLKTYLQKRGRTK